MFHICHCGFDCLHIYLFLMSYNSSYTSVGDSDTTFSYNHINQSVPHDVLGAPLDKFDFYVNYLLDGSYIGFYSQKAFRHKVTQTFLWFLGQSGNYIFKSTQYICQFTSLVFHIIPCRFRWVPGRKFTPTSQLGKFLKFDIFPGHSSSPHRDTKTGCIHKENLTAEQMFIQNIY